MHKEELLEEAYWEGLKKKYPSLFPEGLPDYMLECPVGWRPLLSDLLGTIHRHANNPYATVPNKRWQCRLAWWLRNKTTGKLANICYRVRQKRYPRWYAIRDAAEMEKYEKDRLMRLVFWITNLDHKVEKRLPKRYVPRGDIRVGIAQTKEKFGGLRVYLDGGDSYISGAISLAESISYRTCINDGKPGKLYTEGWHTVRCPECQLAYENRYKKS